VDTGTLNRQLCPLITCFINTEFEEANASAIKDKEALKKMVRDKHKAAPYKLYEHYLSNRQKCMVGAM
jgi:hypothetical protein